MNNNKRPIGFDPTAEMPRNKRQKGPKENDNGPPTTPRKKETSDKAKAAADVHTLGTGNFTSSLQVTFSNSNREPRRRADASPLPGKRFWPPRDMEDRDAALAIAKQSGGGRIALAMAKLGQQGILSKAGTTTTTTTTTLQGASCEKCHGLRLSCILGHDVTIDDMEYFHNYPASRFDLKYVYKQSRPCEMCEFMRRCLDIERSSGNPGNSSKPKLALLSASEFFGIKDRKGFIDAPCLAFASKKKDRRGCILPVASPFRTGTILGRKIEPDKIDFGILSQWLTFCQKKHNKLCQRRSGVINTYSIRVIDCVTREIRPLPNAEEDYVTLSYVWGISAASEKGDVSRLPASVPKVIEDAITVTLKLGLRFLWIDRYCIPQDKNDEKHSQLRNMGNIYSHSVLTIIAAAGEGPDIGLPGVSSYQRDPQPSVLWGNDHLVYCTSRGARSDFQSSKWNSRGWTYQEGLLALRRLVFTKREVYFQCQAMHQAESIATNLDTVQASKVFPLSADFGVMFPKFQDLQRSIKSFQSRVDEFIFRDLTFESDALDAFRGILALFEESRHPINHLCGIPLFSRTSYSEPDMVTPTEILATGLSWKFDYPMSRRFEFPSWSWLGWKLTLPKNLPSVVGSCFRVVTVEEHQQNPWKDMAHDYTLDATVEFRDGEKLSWDEEALNRVNKQSMAGKIPRFLILVGWGLEVTVEQRTKTRYSWDKSKPDQHDIKYWDIKKPETLTFQPRYLGSELLSGVDETSRSLDPSGQVLFGFILGVQGRKQMDSPSNGWNTLVLLLLKEMDNGIFERVGCDYCYLKGEFVSDLTNKRIGNVGLIRKQVRLS